MSYDYWLAPTSENKTFSPETLDAMRDYLGKFPTYSLDDGTILLFANAEERDQRVPSILSDLGKRNNYLTPTIRLRPDEVTIYSVADEETNRLLYEFVRWCQDRWPCELHFAGQIVPAEYLIEEP